MPNNISRRELLRQAGLAAGLAALGGVWTEGKAKASRSPNEKLNIACIGVGGMGWSDLNSVSSENIVALCDVDENNAANAFKKYPNIPHYKDYRVMLDKEAKRIDAVTVSTPDHHHAPAAVLAMKHGKHVYVQKPLAHTVSEARAMMLIARERKVVTQMGTQGHPSYWRLVEYIHAGVIGPVTEAHVMTDRPAGWWPQGVSRPTDTPPVPATLAWDLWLGPAPQRPYNPAYLPFKWRGWWDFGTGALGDMGCHLMDGAFLALKLKYPLSVEAQGEPRMPETGPLWSIIRYEFPWRDEMPPVSLTWYDGGKQIPQELLGDEKLDKGFNGSLFVGSKGKLLVPHGGEPKPIPAALFKDFQAPPQTLPRPEGGHYVEWINACKKGAPGTTGSTFDYACPLAESVLLGNVALRVGKKIEWDAANLKAANCPEADQYVQHRYRKGWSL
jgi:predicted dehydrogenase